MKISTRLLLLFLLVAVLPLVLFGYFNLQQEEALLRIEAQKNMSDLADKKVNQLKSYLAERVQDVRFLTSAPRVMNAIGSLPKLYSSGYLRSSAYAGEDALMHQFFSSYVEETGSFYDVFLITPQGEVVYTQKHEADFATNLFTGPYRDTQLAQAFRNTSMTLEPVISGYEYYTPSSAPALFITAPVMIEGRFKGVLAVQLGNEAFYRVAKDAIGLGVSGEAVFAQKNGDGVVHTTPLKYRDDAELKFRVEPHEHQESAMFRAVSGESGAGLSTDYRGKPILAAWRYLPELDWGVVVKVDADEVFAPIVSHRMLMLEVLLGLMLFTGLAAYYFSRQISKPLNSMAGTVGEMATGNLTVRADEDAPGELGLFAQAFNRMAEKLQELYHTLEDRVEERTRDLNVTNEQLQEEITEREQAEEALRKREASMRAILDNSPYMSWLKDPEGRYIMVNKVFANYFQMDISEIIGKTDLDFQRKELAERYRADDAEVMATCQQKHVEEHAYDGEKLHWVETFKTPIVDEHNHILGTTGFARDITERKFIQIELQHNQDMLNTAQRLGKLGSWELNLESGELRWSDEVYRIFEQDPEVFKPSYENFLNMTHPDDRDKVNRAYTQSLEDMQAYDIEHRLRMADGRIKWVHEYCTGDFDASGKPLRSVGAVQDITHQKFTEDQLREAAVAFETHEAILVTDTQPHILRVNRSFEQLTGYTQQEVLGKNPHMLTSGRQDQTFYAEMWGELLAKGTWSGELWDRHKDGHEYPKWLTITAIQNNSGETTGYVGIFTDISERKKAEEDIRNLAFYDSLTKLANRRLLMDRFHLALSLSARSHQYGAVLFLDLDRFKTINDTLGHQHGDLLLVDAAKRIQECVREVDTVARLGGDEFVILVEELAPDAQETSQKAALIAEKIRTSLAIPYEILGHPYHSSASIGVCLYHGAEETEETLLKHADLAMYHAKDGGRNTVRFFDPVMQHSVDQRAALESDLRSAVSNGQLQLHYQIQVDNEHHPLGAEALVRWVHPVRGMVSPGLFISVAEESSLILEIGDWVMDTACRQLAEWSKNELTRDLLLAVNVSGQQFRLHDFVDRVGAAVRTHRIAPSLLKLELTESVVLSDVADVVKKMHALKGLGVRLSLDDFGTGYSSLSYLKQLPLDQLKIDQSFVRDITTDMSDAVLVQTIIDLAKNFRLNVIAEGVETEAQRAFLEQNGCMAYQGYLFSKPVPIEDFEKLLKKLRIN